MSRLGGKVPSEDDYSEEEEDLATSPPLRFKSKASKSSDENSEKKVEKKNKKEKKEKKKDTGNQRSPNKIMKEINKEWNKEKKISKEWLKIFKKIHIPHWKGKPKFFLLNELKSQQNIINW